MGQLENIVSTIDVIPSPTAAAQPVALPLDPAGLPDDPAMGERRFVCFRMMPKPGTPGKFDKIPVNPATGENARSNDPATWDYLPSAIARYPEHGCHGISIVLDKPASIVGADLDQCRNPTTGEIAPWARRIIEHFSPCYWGPSVSGTGIRILFRATLPAGGKKQGDIELYDAGRHLTLTGHLGDTAVRTLEPRQAALDAFLAEHFPEPAPRPTPPPSTASCSIGDDERLAAALRHATFGPLYHGDQRHYPSASEGDAAFALIGLFYAAGDAETVDRWYRQSSRRREKWDVVHHSNGDTYGQGTLAHALSVWDGASYDPAYRSSPPAPAPDDTPRLAALVRELAEERRRRERAEVQLARCREEHARKVARIAELETEVKALDACIAHSSQTVGGAAPDIAGEIAAAYQRGDTLVQDGKEYARVVNTQAAKRRSSTTVGRAVKTIAAARPDDIITRTETIETARFKGPVDISYIHIPPEHRQRPADITLHLLPPPTKKLHGGDHRITVPPEVSAQDAPVRRETRRVERFFSLLTDAQLGIIEGKPFTDFCTAAGTPMTAAEAEAYRVGIGAQPAPPPRYRPVQSRLQDARRVPYVPCVQDAGGSPVGTTSAATVPSLVQDASGLLADEPGPLVQDASGFEPLPIFRNQGCTVASCSSAPDRDGYCAEHHPDRWGDYAAAREYATREVFAL